RAARYSASVISVASFCRGGCAGGGFAELEDDPPPNNQGFVRLSCVMTSAAFLTSPASPTSTADGSSSFRPSKSTIPARKASAFGVLVAEYPGELGRDIFDIVGIRDRLDGR